MDPGAVQAHRVGAADPQSRLGGSGQSCQLEQASLISMRPGFLLKDRLGRLLKMLTLQLTFGRCWQTIKPALKIGAAGRGGGGGPGRGDPAGWGPGQLPWVRLCFLPPPPLAG